LDLLGGSQELKEVQSVSVIFNVAFERGELAAERDDGVGVYAPFTRTVAVGLVALTPNDVRRLYILIASTDSADNLVLHLGAGV
jgi:hypothetical protein